MHTGTTDAPARPRCPPVGISDALRSIPATRVVYPQGGDVTTHVTEDRGYHSDPASGYHSDDVEMYDVNVTGLLEMSNLEEQDDLLEDRLKPDVESLRRRIWFYMKQDVRRQNIKFCYDLLDSVSWCGPLLDDDVTSASMTSSTHVD